MCKYNAPLFVKLEKIEVLEQLANKQEGGAALPAGPGGANFILTGNVGDPCARNW